MPMKALILLVLFLSVADRVYAQYGDTSAINNTLSKIEDEVRAKTTPNENQLKEIIKASEQLNFSEGVAKVNIIRGLNAKNEKDSAGFFNNFDQAISILSRSKNNKQLADCYRTKGFALNKWGKYDLSVEAYQTGLEIASKYKLAREAARIQSALAGVYRLKGDYDKAIYHGSIALKNQDLLKEEKDMSFTLDRLGVVYKLTKKLNKALESHKRSYTIRQTIIDASDQDKAYSAMVVGDTYLAMDSLDQANKYFQESLNIYEKIKDNEGIAYCFNHLGTIALRTGNQKLASDYFNKALKVFQGLNDKRGQVNALFYLTKSNIESKDYKSAEITANQFQNLALSIDSKSHIVSAYKFQYLIAKANNDVFQALRNHELWMTAKDSVFNQEKANEIAAIEEQSALDTERKTQSLQKELLKSRLKGDHIKILGLGLVLLLSLCFLWYAYKMFNRQKQLNADLKYLNERVLVQNSQLKQTDDALREINVHLEHKVEERTADLIRSNEQLEQYVYLASHDLKQPLRSISGFSQLLEKELPVDSKTVKSKEYLDYIIQGVKYMGKLIEDLIDYAKVDNVKMSDESVFNIRAVVDDVLKSLSNEIEGKQAIVINEINEKSILGNPIRLHQVFFQLFENALHFTSNGITPKIIMESKIFQDYIQFTISDNGFGIAEEYLEKVFEPFIQLGAKYIHGGSGMGLSISRRNTELMGGKIWIESDAGSGTKVHFTIKFKNPPRSADKN